MTVVPLLAVSASEGRRSHGKPIAGGPFVYRGLSHAKCGTKPYHRGRPPSLRHTWHFASQSSLHPMRVHVLTRKRGTAPGYVFLAPYAVAGDATGQTGSLILSSSGEPIWFRPLPDTNLANTDFRAQKLDGRPVLTFWQGTVAVPPREANLPGGYPEPGACWYILDRHYRLVGTIAPRRGFSADVHEFTITRRHTAVFFAAKKVPLDLRRYGGPPDGFIEDQEIQEIDLRTGRLVFSWDALKHLDPALSKLPASTANASDGNVWDAFHLNSVESVPNGRLLISARNMWAIYDVKKAGGRIAWQLGGKRSDFALRGDAAFAWQHMARWRGPDEISLFDDGCCASPTSPPEQRSHGLVLRLDFNTVRATAVTSYYHHPPLDAKTQGALERLRGGNWLVGWGSEPYYSEYTTAGKLVYDVRMPGFDISYRAYNDPWVGEPTYPPRVAVRRKRGHSVVYASWNGSTRVASWRVLAGRSPGSLADVLPKARRTGFETALVVSSSGPYFRVEALAANGEVIGTSKAVR